MGHGVPTAVAEDRRGVWVKPEPSELRAEGSGEGRALVSWAVQAQWIASVPISDDAGDAGRDNVGGDGRNESRQTSGELGQSPGWT